MPRVHVPVLGVIVVATLLSTSASLAGGLLLYFEGLNSLEASVKETSSGELHALHESTHVLLAQTQEFLSVAHTFLFSHERVHGTDPEGWADTTRLLWQAQLAGSAFLYHCTVHVHPQPHDNSSAFFSRVWGDVDDGVRIVRHARLEEDHVARAYALDPETGLGAAVVGEWDEEASFAQYPVTLLNPAAGVYPDLAGSAADVAGAAVSWWGAAVTHRRSDSHVGAHSDLVAVFAPPPAPHPWSAHRAVVLQVGFLYDAMRPAFSAYNRARPDTTVIVVCTATGAVLATTAGVPVVPQWCQGHDTPPHSDITQAAGACMHNISALTGVERAAYEHLTEAWGRWDFKRADLNGDAYYMRRARFGHNWEFLWLRPVASVEGKVQDALVLLIVFTVLVLVFDASISVTEVGFIALPVRRLAASVAAAGNMNTEEAAQAIAGYESRCVMVTEMRQLMSGMAVAVEQLRVYKAFIPEAVFADGHNTPHVAHVVRHSSLHANSSVVPGTGSSEAAVVFTDIKGSTLLWETVHDSMRLGLQRHNEVVRACIADWGGYEVKTIGDAFMVAFDTLDSAVLFALAVHERLACVEWPAQLLEANGGEGLVLRVGVSHGAVSVEYQEAWACHDFFGTTVHKAAQLEAMCVPGAVAVATECLDSVASLLPKFEVLDMGTRTLRGLVDPMAISFLIPRSLPARAEEVKRSAQGRNPLCGRACKKPLRAKSMKSLNHAKDVLEVAESATTGHLEHLVPGDTSYEVTVVLNAALVKTMASLERSDGKIITVLGSAVYMGWNVLQACCSHTEKAFRFVGLITKNSGETRIRCGISSGGRVMAGKIGTRGQGFFTAIGVPMRQCSWLLCRCEAFGADFLYTSASQLAVQQLCLKGRIRPLEDTALMGMQFRVHEVHCRRIREWCRDKSGALLSTGANTGAVIDTTEDGSYTHETCWSATYMRAFDEMNMSVLSSLAGIDPVIDKVYQRLIRR